jgi:adenylate cyclase
MTDDRRRIAVAIKDYLARERISREQFAFKTKLGKSTIDKLLTGLFSDRTLSIVESHTNLTLRPALEGQAAQRRVGDSREEASKPLDGPSIAVLPFANFGGDPEQEFFADGVVEDLITALSRMRNYFVIARNSSFTYKGRAIDVRQVGRELGVKYVIEGSVRKAGNRIRVTAQLIEASSGAHVWAEKYDRPLDDMFDVQDEIVRGVAASTQTEVLLHRDDSPHKPPRPDMTTWELAKKAWMAAYGFSRQGHETAVDLAKLTIARDPANALGYEVLASVQMHLVYMGFAAEPEVLAQEALGSIRRALELGGASEYSHWVHGTVIGFLFGKHEQACTALRQAIDLNPNFSLAYGTLGTMLVLAGKPDEGIRNTEFAIRLNPRDPGVFFRYSGLSLAYLMKRDFSTALDWAERSASRNPDWWMAHALIAAIHSMQSRAGPARTAMEDLRRVLPSATLGNLPWRSFLSGTEFANVNRALRELGLPE